MNNTNDYASFYNERRIETYSQDYENYKASDSIHYEALDNFIKNYNLKDKKILEIGSSGGFFQDMVNNYTGVDIADSLRKYYHKPYFVATDTGYPFPSSEFDAIWTFDVYEHIPDLQNALLEIKRLIRPGGVVLFQPAWQCRSWAADGYAVRPYSDFNLYGKIIKLLIPLRNSILWRAMFIFPKRLFRHTIFLLGSNFLTIKYKKIKPNYDIFWTSDSDACNNIDPHDSILWFCSNGFECLSHSSNINKLMVRTGGLIFRKL